MAEKMLHQAINGNGTEENIQGQITTLQNLVHELQGWMGVLKPVQE